MTSQSASKAYRVTGRNILAISTVMILFAWVTLCFCSFLPFLLFLSFLFNAVFLGSSLFSALSQEREKRTIDALRLTQLSSLDILFYKSFAELRLWRTVNAALILLSAGAAFWAKSPLLWAVGGASALACGGLLSISLALAVSTRCDTTSSAVVTGWISKGVWLVGLPILDFVLEAVLVLKSELHFFSYLDPLWIYQTVVGALIYETGAMTLTAMLVGAVASVVIAYLLLQQSGRIIDTSFESSATLEDRNRHSVYSQRFPLGLHNNPFMVREMAWQMRTGAGAWPGYAVFFTLFLAPFLYGFAQQHKHHEHKPVKIVRQSVSQPRTDDMRSVFTVSQPIEVKTDVQVHHDHSDENIRYHGHFCLSQMMGLPVARKARYSNHRQQKRIVVQANGRVSQVSEHVAGSMVSGKKATKKSPRRTVRRTQLQKELDRGLLTGLVLTLLYLFIRGGAFMSGAVTGEKERRAWDQIALTGARSEDYLLGKLAGVLFFPLKQLLMTSPVLILFALYGGVSFLDILLVVPLLVMSFLAAANVGLLTSATQSTSHQAQGMALLAGAAILLCPLVSGGWLLAGLCAMGFLSNVKMAGAEKQFAAVSVALWVGLFGSAASPLAGVMGACGYDGLGPVAVKMSSLPPTVGLLIGFASMAALAYGAFRLSVRTLNDGGSVEA